MAFVLIGMHIAGAVACAEGETLDPTERRDDPSYTDAALTVPGTPVHADPACTTGTKPCDGVCVAPSPAVGCSLTDCTPCPAAPPGVIVVCDGTTCGTSSTTDPLPTDPTPDNPPEDPDFERCVALTTDNACTRCVCRACLPQALACGDSADATRNQHCSAIVDCGRENGCTSIACYCGGDLSTCEDAPQGACVAPIQAAAGSTLLADVAAGLENPSHAIFLANQVGDCAQGNCPGDCGL
jgi:hypothetical protein